MDRRYFLLFLLVAIAATAYKPIQKTHKKGLHQKYTATGREETVYKWWLNTLPQYHLWQKKKKDLARWQQKYAALPLPDSAVIIDEKIFETPKGKRTILAWMTYIDIDIHTYEYSVYIGCPASTQGTGFYMGDLHFSLLNTANTKIINTVNVVKYDSSAMIYPFSIANPRIRHDIFQLCYAAKGGSKTADGEADIIHLFDFNNDGKAYEFAMFDVNSCTPPVSTLIGYNPQKDALIWYPFHLIQKNNTRYINDSLIWVPDYQDTVIEYWPGSAMKLKFNNEAQINFSIDERGRGGAHARYYLNYNRTTDTYAGILDMRDLPGDSSDYSYVPGIHEIKDTVKHK